MDKKHNVILGFKGESGRLKELAVVPESIDFGEIYSGCKVTRKVYFHGRSALLDKIPSNINIDSIDSSLLKIHNIDGSDELGVKAVEFSICIEDIVSIGRFESFFNIQVSGRDSLRVSIPITAYASPSPIKVSPEQLFVSVSNEGRESSSFLLRSINKQPIKIKSITGDFPMTWKIDESSTDVLKRITWQPQVSLPLVNPRHGKIKIELDNQNLLEIPVVIIESKI